MGYSLQITAGEYKVQKVQCHIWKLHESINSCNGQDATESASSESGHVGGIVINMHACACP